MFRWWSPEPRVKSTSLLRPSMRPQKSYKLVHEQHAVTVARFESRNSSLAASLIKRQPSKIVDWVWVCNTAVTIHQGVDKNTDDCVLEAKLASNWIGPFKTLSAGLTSDDDSPYDWSVGSKLLYMDLSSDLCGLPPKNPVTVVR